MRSWFTWHIQMIPKIICWFFDTIRCDVSVDLDPTAIQSIQSLLNPVHFFAANHVRKAIHREERILRNKCERWRKTASSSHQTGAWSKLEACLAPPQVFKWPSELGILLHFSGTSPFYIILVVVLVLIFVAALLIYLWRFSERVQR